MLLLLVGYGFNPQAAEDVDLFPRVKEKGNEIEKAFPLNITVDTFSDIVLVKCPGSKYKHSEQIKGSFKHEGTADDQDFSSIEKPEKKISWKAVFIDNPTKKEATFTCGELYIKVNSTIKSVKWELLIKWNPTVEINPLKERITGDLNSYSIANIPYDKCGNEHLLLVKRNDGKLEDYIHGTNYIYKGNLFYIFNKRLVLDLNDTVNPCAVIKPRAALPEVELKNITSTEEVVFGGENIYLFSLNGKKIAVGIHLVIKQTDFTNEKAKMFFSKEPVRVISQKIGINNKLEDLNEIPLVNNEIVFEKYQIFKVEYKCIGDCREGDGKTNKIYFVGPKGSNEFGEDLPQQIFKEGNLKEKPHCSIIHNTFGFLQTMSYTENNATTSTDTTYDSIKDGSLVNGFKINDDIVEYEKTNPNGRFTCVYTIPGGTYTIRKDFKCHSESAVIRDDKGSEFLPGQPGYNDLKDKNDEANKAKIKAELEEAKRKEEEAKRIAAERMRNTIIGSSVGGMLIFVVIFIVLFFLNKKKIQYYQMKKRLARNYPMVFKFWEFFQVLKHREVSRLLEDKKYAPMDPPLKKVSIEKSSEVEEDEIDFSFYDKALIKPRDGATPYCFKAYGLSSMYDNKKYILSEGPKPKDFNDFWKMIYDNDVKVITAIVYQSITEDIQVYEHYWSENKVRYGDINIKSEMIINANLAWTKKYRITMEHNGESRDITLYFVTNWKSGFIPESTADFIELYECILKDSSKSNVVIHSSGYTGSRCFLFTYFAIIIEALKYGTDSSNPSHWNPMQIIKDVREKVYGGELSGLEFSFLINSVVEYFGKKDIIPKDDSFFLFTRNFQEYLHEIRVKESSHVSSVKSFLVFLNTLDQGKVRSLVQGYCHLHVNRSTLLPLCRKFVEVYEIQNKIKDDEILKYEQLYLGTNIKFDYIAMRDKFFVCRYDDVYSLDATNIVAFDETAGPDKYKNFMHANTYTYEVKNVFSREMILCQAPITCRNSRMIDMIYQQKVVGVVNLCRNDELTIEKWQIYYPIRVSEEITYGKYRIKMIEKLYSPSPGTNVAKYVITDTKSRSPGNDTHIFNLIHFLNWPDMGIIKDMSQFIGLYKTIIRLTEKKKILIHCSAGIGRTGTLALFMTLVDTLEAGKSFDLQNTLANLRNCRAQAVQTPAQYLMVIKALLLYYKNQVDKFDEGLYEKADTAISEVIGLFK